MDFRGLRLRDVSSKVIVPVELGVDWPFCFPCQVLYFVVHYLRGGLGGSIGGVGLVAHFLNGSRSSSRRCFGCGDGSGDSCHDCCLSCACVLD